MADERAIAAVLNQHLWVGHATHRAQCDCNWRAPSGNGITGQREHAAHVAAAIAAAPAGDDAARALDDLIERFGRAADSLYHLAANQPTTHNGYRLEGKREGVMLAKSYAEEARREVRAAHAAAEPEAGR